MTNQSIVDHFNDIAPFYDIFKTRNKVYYQTLKNAVKNEITIKKPTILDIGCGTGSVLSFLNPFRGVGIDSSQEMIKIARKKYSTNKHLSFSTFDIEEKPYLIKRFDYILFNDVIEHVTSQKKAIAHISQSMHEDTKFILSMANPGWEPILMMLEKMRLKMPEGPHKRISESTLKKYLQANRLQITTKKVYFPRLLFFKQLGLIYVYTIKKMVS